MWFEAIDLERLESFHRLDPRLLILQEVATLVVECLHIQEPDHDHQIRIATNHSSNVVYSDDYKRAEAVAHHCFLS